MSLTEKDSLTPERARRIIERGRPLFASWSRGALDVHIRILCIELAAATGGFEYLAWVSD